MNKREKKLFKVLAGLILLIGGLAGIKFYSSYMNNLQKDHDESNLQASRYKQSEELARVFEKDKTWLDNHEPDPVDYSKAMTRFQSFISGSARMNGLSYTSSGIDEIDDNGGYFRKIQSRVSNVRGTQEQMIKWLCELHKPSEYRAVTSLSVVPDEKDQDSVIFTLTVDLFLVELK